MLSWYFLTSWCVFKFSHLFYLFKYLHLNITHAAFPQKNLNIRIDNQMSYVYIVTKYIDFINKLVISLEHRYSLMSLSDIEEWVSVTDA